MKNFFRRIFYDRVAARKCRSFFESNNFPSPSESGEYSDIRVIEINGEMFCFSDGFSGFYFGDSAGFDSCEFAVRGSLADAAGSLFDFQEFALNNREIKHGSRMMRRSEVGRRRLVVALLGVWLPTSFQLISESPLIVVFELIQMSEEELAIFDRDEEEFISLTRSGQISL